jgi:hypothetical protein
MRGGFETTSREKSMRIKILLDNDLPTDEFKVFYLLYDKLTPVF